VLDTNDALLTVGEVATHLRVGSESVRRWLRAGRLPGINLGRGAGWRIRSSDLALMLVDPSRRNGSSSVAEVAPTQDIHVTCVHKISLQNPHSGITHLGNGTAMWTKAEVIVAIRSGSHRFFTLSGDTRADVQVCNGPFDEYLRARVGDRWDDSLLSIGECAD
jgi:excisionase family DNA binding protein